ncbi:hypothetical protein Csa_008155 [Cucumis sativus]|nr:hypothetical protein Csa_008155 [Cucumis sativus]
MIGGDFHLIHLGFSLGFISLYCGWRKNTSFPCWDYNKISCVIGFWNNAEKLKTYDGMIIGEHSRELDLDVNLVRTKENLPISVLLAKMKM